MTNYKKTIGALTAVSALSATSLMAGPAPIYSEPSTPAAVESAFDAEIHVGYDTKYLFRGIQLGDDLVHAGLDVGTSVAGLDLSAGAWYGSWNADTALGAPGGAGPTTDADELDLYGEIAKDLGFATVGLGYIYYHFPLSDTNNGAIDDAQEVYLSVSKEIFGIDASIAYFWDVETDNDGYSQLSLSKGFEIMPYVTLATGCDFGYLVEEGDFVHATAKVGIDIEASENATISYYVAHTWTLSEGGRQAGATSTTTAGYQGQENEFFGGASISVSF